MMRQLTLFLDRPVEKDPQRHDDLITVESYRDSIIKLVNEEPESIRSAVNHMRREMPSVIYSRPYKNQIRMFGLGERGAAAINTIALLLSEQGGIIIKNERYRITKLKRSDAQEFLPRRAGGSAVYTTLTPINIYNKRNHPAFLEALMDTCEGPFAKATPQQQKAFDDLAKQFALQQIKSFVSYYLECMLGEGEYPFVEEIEIEWEDFRIVHAKYHSQELKMPMVTGKFRCNFTLPKFVGYKIGKGFGELSLKSIETEEMLKCS